MKQKRRTYRQKDLGKIFENTFWYIVCLEPPYRLGLDVLSQQ